jgi:hypothetical protein
MSTAALKKKIKALIDEETNVQRLQLAYTLLVERGSGVEEPTVPYAPARKGKKGDAEDIQKMQGMKDAVATSEREFAEGKGIPLDQFEQEIDAMLDEVYA